jgi:hypothetical protein
VGKSSREEGGAFSYPSLKAVTRNRTRAADGRKDSRFFDDGMAKDREFCFAESEIVIFNLNSVFVC